MSYLYVTLTPSQLSATRAAVMSDRIEAINPSTEPALFSALSVSSLLTNSSPELLVLPLLEDICIHRVKYNTELNRAMKKWQPHLL